MSEDQNPFVVHKREVRVGVRLVTGKHLSGVIQCDVRADDHHGQQRVKDVLNSSQMMLPIFSIDDGQCVLVNKSFIQVVELFEPDLAQAGDTDLTTHRQVELLLANGAELRGTILVSTPPERARTLDFLNRGERFFYLETEQGSRVIGLEHVVAVSDQTPP